MQGNRGRCFPPLPKPNTDQFPCRFWTGELPKTGKRPCFRKAFVSRHSAFRAYTSTYLLATPRKSILKIQLLMYGSWHRCKYDVFGTVVSFLSMRMTARRNVQEVHFNAYLTKAEYWKFSLSTLKSLPFMLDFSWVPDTELRRRLPSRPSPHPQRKLSQDFRVA